MNRHFQRVRRATWSYKQPLTRKPAIAGAPVSDLFVWRINEDWETFFELTDLPALFLGRDTSAVHVTLVFFDKAGQPFLEKTAQITPGRRNTLALSQLIGSGFGSYGTFSVFHTHSPQCLQGLGSHISERGYVSYCYRDAPLRAYVHGNMDAVARLPDKSLQLLGGVSIRLREYNLQYSMGTNGYYELFLVNSTPTMRRINCLALSSSCKLLLSEAVELSPRGSHLFRAAPQREQLRIVIRSRLIMARPLVFHIQNSTMDVFHG